MGPNTVNDSKRNVGAMEVLSKQRENNRTSLRMQSTLSQPSFCYFFKHDILFIYLVFIEAKGQL